MIETLAYASVFLLSIFGVNFYRRWSLKRQLFDIPNERSSHQNPKPRGGGMVFVLISLAFYLIYGAFFGKNYSWGYFFAAFAIAFISWLDDLFNVSFVWRLMVQTFSALLIVWDTGYFQTVYLPYIGQFNFGLSGVFFTLFWIVWLTNAYNFMDGIDGLAGLQAFTAGLGWLVSGKILGINEVANYGGIIAFSCAGFLFYNWEPAKIFMGDVGSAFLGFTFSVLPLLARNEKPEYSHILPVIGVLLLWLFIFDSVFTLVRRTLKRERIWEAHREHIYQRLVIKGYSHKFVTGLYGINSIIILGYVLFWLYMGNNFLQLVLLPITIQSLGILLLSYKKHIFLKT